MSRNNFLPILSLFMIISLSIPFLFSARAESDDDMKSLIIVSGYGGYTSHELNKASSFRNHLLDSCSSDDIIYLTDTGMSGSDGTATVSNVEDAFFWLINNCDSNTKVAVYIMDHMQMINNQPRFRFDNGVTSASEMDSWLDQVSCAEMTVILNGEKSALCGPSLDTSSRDVICSMGSQQTYCPDNFDIADSLDDPSADTDGDGTVSYIEAYENEKDLLESSGQVPVLY